MTNQTPQEIDTQLAELDEKAAGLENRIASALDRLYRVAGYRKITMGRRQVWKRTAAEMLEDIQGLIARGDAYSLTQGCKPSEALAAWNEKKTMLAQVQVEMAALDEIYRRSPWTRFFPCNNSNGHIHASMGCHTLNKGQFRTDMGWYPQLSGKTVDDAVAELGTWLCSVCFPAAPAEHCQTRSEATRAEREAAKAEREAAKLVKNLREDERFRDHRGSWVETVAACKQALRDEVELRDYYGHGEHCDHAASVETAAAATRVLLARGVTQKEISKIIASAVTRNRKDGARLDKEGNVIA